MLGRTELKNVFENIAASIGQDHGIKVIPSNRCETDMHQRIYFPFNADYFLGFDKNVLHGKLDHEICHILDERERKAKGEKTASQLLKKIKEPSLKLLFNLYIDILTERTFSDRMIGLSQNLRSHQLDSSRFLRESMDKGQLNFFGIIVCGILSIANGVEYRSWMPVKYHFFKDLFAEEIRNIDFMKTPEDALELAKSTFKKMKKIEREEKKETGKSDLKFSLVEWRLDDLSKLVEEYIEVKYKEISDDYYPDEEILKEDDWSLAKNGSLEEYQKCVGLISSQTKVLKKRFSLILKAKTKCKTLYGQREGEFNNDDLASFMAGNKDVYYQVRKGQEIDTAELYLIDLSGSMGRNHIKTNTSYHARLALIALAQADDFLNIPFEAIGFRNLYYIKKNEHKGNIRNVAFNYVIFKTFNERYSRVKRRFVTVNGMGDNIDGEALMAAACRLFKRREKRKILNVISDGIPRCRGLSRPILEKQLTNNIRIVSRSGIEVFGIGVGPAADCVKRFYTKENGADNIYVPNVLNLAAELCRKKAEILRVQ